MALRSKRAQLHAKHAKPYRVNKIIETILNKEKQKKEFIAVKIQKHNWKK